jgi:hypothetical protein
VNAVLGLELRAESSSTTSAEPTEREVDDVEAGDEDDDDLP